MKIRTFLNDVDEWHSLVLGWSAAVCPYRSEHLEAQSARRVIWKEPWYFGLGLVAGIVTLVNIITGSVIIVLLIGGVI